ncbi:hypothetical protein CCM_03907 [Cordyceps militaris CM01]|uniref:Ubiquitin-like domain-containing protein n=1 Tax=Cordyceps militaris (strain CM01) TaxID=983644 RepID=G3JD59_CORMM|nr:uncharacterized protein CCM_03907 [Cordyceps militaris CM01]EGX92534.1 hypothetical protein CCM_03907 [Cordyceps militaris CM01]
MSLAAYLPATKLHTRPLLPSPSPSPSPSPPFDRESSNPILPHRVTLPSFTVNTPELTRHPGLPTYLTANWLLTAIHRPATHPPCLALPCLTLLFLFFFFRSLLCTRIHSQYRNKKHKHKTQTPDSQWQPAHPPHHHCPPPTTSTTTKTHAPPALGLSSPCFASWLTPPKIRLPLLEYLNLLVPARQPTNLLHRAPSGPRPPRSSVATAQAYQVVLVTPLLAEPTLKEGSTCVKALHTRLLLCDEESFHDGYGYVTHDEDNWADDDDISESEASVSYGAVPPAPRAAHPARLPLRTTQPLPHQEHYRPARRVPNPAPSVDHHDEYGPYAQGYPGGQYGRGGYPRSGHQPPQGYGYYPQGQVMAYNGNPFSPAASPYTNPASYAQDPRYGSELAQYPQYFPYQQYPMAHPGMHLEAPAAPTPVAPAPPPAPAGPTPREIQLQDQVAAFEKAKQLQELAEREKQIEAEARRKAAEESRKLVEEMERFKEQTKIELNRAREEAARATRDGIAAEAAAAAEREKQKAEAVKQAEERVRIMYEDARRAEEARKKKEAEEHAKAEAAHKLRLEAALRADAEAKAAAAKAAAAEAEKVKQIQDEAKRKADAEFAARIQAEKDAAAKKAELEALAKAEKDAYTKKVQEETKANLEAAAKKDRGPFIQFKDALNRKYSFPYRLCTTWPNMEELIKQAFDNVEHLAHSVHEGWYDLFGPEKQIILPSLWEKTIEPEWTISMAMWPPERIQRDRAPPGMMAGMARGRGMAPPPAPPPLGRGRGGMPGGMMPPEGWGVHKPTPVPPGIHVVRDPGKKDKKKKGPPPAVLLGFLSGKAVKKKYACRIL